MLLFTYVPERCDEQHTNVFFLTVQSKHSMYAFPWIRVETLSLIGQDDLKEATQTVKTRRKGGWNE